MIWNKFLKHPIALYTLNKEKLRVKRYEKSKNPQMLFPDVHKSSIKKSQQQKIFV